jgi:hypothetical protein
MNLRLDPEIADRVLVGAAWFSGVLAAVENPHWSEMDALADTLRRAHAGLSPGEIEVGPARRATASIDPTRTRPSSEALLRRVLKTSSTDQPARTRATASWPLLRTAIDHGGGGGPRGATGEAKDSQRSGERGYRSPWPTIRLGPPTRLASPLIRPLIGLVIFTPPIPGDEEV